MIFSTTWCYEVSVVVVVVVAIVVVVYMYINSLSVYCILPLLR